MTIPAIRYPLPTLVAAMLACLLLWKGEEWSRPTRQALSVRIQKVVAGPEVPRSPNPQIVVGPIRRRVLLLRDGVEASDVPGGRVVQTIRRRMFADVYDVWPLSSKVAPTHYRVGNGRAIGWVPAVDTLEWSTRLVVCVDSDLAAVVGLDPDEIRVAIWEAGHAWAVPARITPIPRPSPTSDAWGVLLSRQEILDLLGATVRAPGEADPAPIVRAQALIGRLGDAAIWTPSDADAALKYLGFAAPLSPKTAAQKVEALSRINEQWTPDAAWSGLSFRVIPLDLVP